MAALDSPVRARPKIITFTLVVSASISDPAARADSDTSSISRRPNMSANLPMTGTATAPTSRVEVSSHWACVPDAFRSRAITGSTGMIRVCASAAINAPRPMAPISRLARRADT